MVPKEDAMLDVMLYLAGWALVGALIVLGARWAEYEREVLGNGHVGWGRLE
jgi:hypothetical protein